MPDQLVSFVVTEEEQRRLERLRDILPAFGQSSIALIEDVIARKAFDALEAE